MRGKYIVFIILLLIFLVISLIKLNFVDVALIVIIFNNVLDNALGVHLKDLETLRKKVYALEQQIYGLKNKAD